MHRCIDIRWSSKVGNIKWSRYNLHNKLGQQRHNSLLILISLPTILLMFWHKHLLSEKKNIKHGLHLHLLFSFFLTLLQGVLAKKLLRFSFLSDPSKRTPNSKWILCTHRHCNFYKWIPRVFYYLPAWYVELKTQIL